MKNNSHEPVIWQFFFSAIALGLFILVATGSLYMLQDKVEYLGLGVYKTTENIDADRSITTTGRRDPDGNWHGPFVIREYNWNGPSYKEEVEMVHGKRHGRSKNTITNRGGFSQVNYKCYNMGKVVNCNGFDRKSAGNISAFQLLSDEYPWFLYALNVFGYDDEYVTAYLDTFATLLENYEFEQSEFDDYYNEVQYILEETPFDSIITINSIFSLHLGLDELLNNEFRLAALNHSRSLEKSTFSIISATYPGYLHNIVAVGIPETDFQQFCQDIDDSLAAYSTLDMEDPFFLDSVDYRLYRVLSAISDSEVDEFSAKRSLKSIMNYSISQGFAPLLREAHFYLTQKEFEATPSEVATVVMSFMLLQLEQQDILKRVVREAWLMNKGVIMLPTVTTVYSGDNLPSGTMLHGYVIEDGGGSVTSRGIAWADFYNPTLNDQVENSGAGVGEFTVTLTGLTEGITYYARTFATNRAGTAYGNCVSFVAGSNVGIEDAEPFAQEITIYPNPAQQYATFNFNLESPGSMTLILFNMKGQEAFRSELGDLPQGENHVELELGELPNGVYHCRLTNKQCIHGTAKLIIAR